MSTLPPDQLQDLARKLKINVPIMAHKVVGSRVELHLLGGVRVTHDLKTALDLKKHLAALSVKELRFLATKLSLPGRSKMTKVQLIEALTDIRQEDLHRILDPYDLGD